MLLKVVMIGIGLASNGRGGLLFRRGCGCGNALTSITRPGLSWWPLSNRCMTRLQAQFNRNGSNYFEKAEGDQHEKKGRLGVRTQHHGCGNGATVCPIFAHQVAVSINILRLVATTFVLSVRLQFMIINQAVRWYQQF